MSSPVAIDELVFTLGVMRYMDKNISNSSFTISIPFTFLIALLNTSTNLSAIPFDLEWYGGDVKCTIEVIFLKISKSFEENCVRHDSSRI